MIAKARSINDNLLGLMCSRCDVILDFVITLTTLHTIFFWAENKHDSEGLWADLD